MNIQSQAFIQFKELTDSSPLGLLYVPKELAHRLIFEIENPSEVLDPSIDALQHIIPVTQYLILRKLALADRRMVSINELRHASYAPLAHQTVLDVVCKLRMVLSELLPERKILNVGNGYCLV